MPHTTEITRLHTEQITLQRNENRKNWDPSVLFVQVKVSHSNNRHFDDG